MHIRIPRRCNALGFMAFLWACLIAAGPLPAAAPERSADDVLKAVVRIDATIPADARTSKSLGTTRIGNGVVIDSKGLIVTIGYVILEAETVKVTQHDGTEFPATVIAYDHNTGFGLVRATQPPSVSPLPLGDSASLKKDGVILVAGFGGSAAAMPSQIVSRRDFAGYWEYLLEDAIFTAPPHANFGGAALLDSAGTLVGIGSLIVADAAGPGSYSPGNMFIPINKLKPILQELVANGRVAAPNNPWLGLYTEEVRGRLFVQRVARGGPAQRAGIKPGDILVSIGEAPITKQIEFYRKLWSYGAPGVSVPLTLLTAESRLRTIDVPTIDRYTWLRKPRGN